METDKNVYRRSNQKVQKMTYFLDGLNCNRNPTDWDKDMESIETQKLQQLFKRFVVNEQGFHVINSTVVIKLTEWISNSSLALLYIDTISHE